MDNYNLTNSHQSVGHSTDAGEHHPRPTDEQNRQATFSTRSTTVATPEQAERQQPPSIGDEQIPEQRVLADFDISLSLDLFEPLTVKEPEDPFASLAAYQSLTCDEDYENYAVSKLGLGSGLLEGFSVRDLTDLAAEDITEVIRAKPEWNEVLEPLVQSEQREQPEQSQGESEKGIVVPESANPDTVPGKRSSKRLAFKRSVVTEHRPTRPSSKKSADTPCRDFLRRSERLAKKGQMLDSKNPEISHLPRGTATRSQSAAVPMPEKSSTPRNYNYIGQSSDRSLRKRVKEETEKLIVVRESERERYMCGYPGCGRTYGLVYFLKRHIFSHIHISVYKCTYPVCARAPYFPDLVALQRHIQTAHANYRP